MRICQSTNSEAGFSLAEMLVAISILSIVGLAMAGTFKYANESSDSASLSLTRDQLGEKLISVVSDPYFLVKDPNTPLDLKDCFDRQATSCKAPSEAVGIDVYDFSTSATQTAFKRKSRVAGTPSNPVFYNSHGGACQSADPLQDCSFAATATYMVLCANNRTSCPDAEAVQIQWALTPLGPEIDSYDDLSPAMIKSVSSNKALKISSANSLKNVAKNSKNSKRLKLQNVTALNSLVVFDLAELGGGVERKCKANEVLRGFDKFGNAECSISPALAFNPGAPAPAPAPGGAAVPAAVPGGAGGPVAAAPTPVPASMQPVVASSPQNAASPFQQVNKSKVNGSWGNVYDLESIRPFSSMPNYSTLTPVSSVGIKSFDIPNQSFEAGFPGIPNMVEWFGIRFYTYLRVPEDGDYTFWVKSDDGAILSLDGNIIVNNDGMHSEEEKFATVNLKKGFHPMLVDYYQGPRYYIALQIFWSTPSDSTKRIIPEDHLFQPLIK